MNSPDIRATWYRVCWETTWDGRAWELGTLTGRDVPSMLVSLRDCLPVAITDLEAVRAAADTPDGWSYELDAMSVHTHQTPREGSWLPYFGCPNRRQGEPP
ncbi:hypothetical protein ACH4TV_27605 [Streptomyces sp. NPDC020898]|uniref:hypothetical protein n=1 Tax=Streptomyces sp. NPDC020898 TaxID=3365101 RepID=UPI0037BA2BAA